MHAERSEIAIINDNNNFALSIFCHCVKNRLWSFWGLCVFFGSSQKYLSPKQLLPILHNDLKKDGAQLLFSK